jgi:hypothetical protein
MSPELATGCWDWRKPSRGRVNLVVTWAQRRAVVLPPVRHPVSRGKQVILALRHSRRRLYVIVSMRLSGSRGESTKCCYL